MTGQPLIPLKQVLTEMAAAKEPFSLRFAKFNEAKGTGGEIVEYPALQLSGRQEGTQEADMTERKGLPVAEARTMRAQPGQITRNPNHSENMTHNLVNARNGRFVKVHIYLIIGFNGKKVLL